MALGVDPSTPAVVQMTSGTSQASASFSPPAYSLLVLMFGMGGASSITGMVNSVTDTSVGGPLTWHKLQQVKYSSNVDAEIWCAYCMTAQTGMTVTPSWTSSSLLNGMVGVIVLTGAASVQNGVVASTNTPSGTITSGVPGTTAGSMIVAMISTAQATGPTIPANQTDIFNGQTFLTASTFSCWAQAQIALSAGGTVTINDTAPTAVQFAMGVVEILAGNPPNIGSWVIN